MLKMSAFSRLLLWNVKDIEGIPVENRHRKKKIAHHRALTSRLDIEFRSLPRFPNRERSSPADPGLAGRHCEWASHSRGVETLVLVSVRVSWGLLYVKTTAHSAVRLGRQNLCCPGNRKFSFSTNSFQAHFQAYFASLQRITKRRKRKSSRPDIGVLEVVCLHRMMQVQAFMADSEVDPDALIRVGCVPRARGGRARGGSVPRRPTSARLTRTRSVGKC